MCIHTFSFVHHHAIGVRAGVTAAGGILKAAIVSGVQTNQESFREIEKRLTNGIILKFIEIFKK